MCYNLIGGQVYSVDYKDPYIYAACGNQGIKILSKSLQVVKEIPCSKTNAIISETVVHGNRLYTSEGLEGIAIYEISSDGLELTEISRYRHEFSSYGVIATRSSKYISLSPDGNYVLSDCGSSRSILVDFTDLNNPKLVGGENSHGGLMYWRQLTAGAINNRYIASFAMGKQSYWYDFGNGTPTKTRVNSFSPGTQAGGVTGLTGKNSEYAIAIAVEGFYIFNPADFVDADTSEITFPSTTKRSFKYANGNTIPNSTLVPGQRLQGKPKVFGDLLVITDRPYGHCYLFDMSELDVEAGNYTIKLITYFSFAGNPDIPKLCGGRIVLPLGNQGVLAFSVKQ